MLTIVLVLNLVLNIKNRNEQNIERIAIPPPPVKENLQ